jgi:hypothetical protein
MAYFTEAELESRTGKVFSATSLVSSTQIGLMATEISAMWDGWAHQTEGTETPSETVKQACLSCAHYTIDQIYAGETVDPIKQYAVFKAAVGATGETATLYYTQSYPDSAGEW